MARRRGQAALEFLSTYGFAFLLILLMIAALSYFGVLNPKNFLPGRCLISGEFRCVDRTLDLDTVPAVDTLTARLVIVNQLGNAVQISAAEATSTISGAGAVAGAPDACVAGVPTGPAFGTQIANDGTASIDCPLTALAAGFPAEGQKAKVAIKITYREVGGTYDRVASAEIADTIV